MNGTAITLANWRGGSRVTHRILLTGGDSVFTTSNPISTEVEIQMLRNDLNTFKASGEVCDKAADCWITFTPNLLQDMAGNQVLGNYVLMLTNSLFKVEKK